VLDYLRQRDMLDNTVVVFASDNGGEQRSCEQRS
jgi:arylsulfatase A-like enzyme